MMAMDSATTSAKDMLKDLSVKLNRGAPGCHYSGDHRDHRRRQGAEKEITEERKEVSLL